MHYKKYILLLLFLTVSFSQIQFNRIVPSDYYLGSARSMGIGNTLLTTGNTSMLILSNPAKISQINSSIFFQSSYLSSSERRSMIITDMWGDFLTNADYVFNDNTLLKNAFGFSGSIKTNNQTTIGVGYNYAPFLSFNYNYEEEVRSDADLEDGVIGIDDPIIGYHILKNKGDTYVQSLGFSCSFSSSSNIVSFGIGLNELKSTKIEDEVFISIIDETEYAQNNLSLVENHSSSLQLEREYFSSLSIEFLYKNNLEIVMSFEDDVQFNSDYFSFSLLSSEGLPYSFGPNYSYTNLEYLYSGLVYEKPQKYNLGISYQPKYNSDFIIAFESTKKVWKHQALVEYGLNSNPYSYYFKNDIMEYRFGFEYSPIKGFPIRAGLVYSESPFKVLDDKTTLTLGTGKSFKNLFLDFALNYNMLKYSHLDLFPSNTYGFNIDTVKENNLIFLVTMRYEF